jgi:large subunit ribosomal protein L3
MKFLLAKKLNMTQVFEENGRVQAVTALRLPPEGQDLSVWKEGELVTATGISKGKGFQGVVKRHGFGGGRRSHGQKHSEREPGSIGGGGRAGGRVAKGKRMAGRMGGDKITVKNLKIIKILPESNEILIQGAVPGRRGTAIRIQVK